MGNQGRIYKLTPTVALLLAALLLLAATADAACPPISGTLRGLEHNVAGKISISEDCTMSVQGFSYDGKAPQAFWWGAPGPCNPSKIKQQGARISNQQLKTSYNNAQVNTYLSNTV